MRATCQLIPVLRPAIGRTSLAVVLTVLFWNLQFSSLSAQSIAPGHLPALSVQRLASAVLTQQVRNPQNKPQPKKADEPDPLAELKRDKEALPLGYKVPPATNPEITIINEIKTPDKTDKAAWTKHNQLLKKYHETLQYGDFHDEKADRESLRYGITYKLHRMTHRSLLLPTDEDRTKVVEADKRPQLPENLVTIRDQLISDLHKTNNGSGAFQIRDAFLDIFLEEAPKLFNNNTYVKYQVAYLLATFNQRDEDKSVGRQEEPFFKATKVLIDLINDEKTQFQSKIFPVRALARICRHKNCKPEDRFQIMEALIKQLGASKTIFWWYGETIAEQLAQIGDPLDRAKNPAVAEALFAVVKDQAYADRVRIMAAHSLGRIPLESFKRTDEIAVEILRLGEELAQAYEKDPKSPHWREDFMRLYLAFQPEDQNERNDKKGLIVQVGSKPALASTRTVVDEAYQHYLPLVQNVLGVMGVTPIPDQLRKIKTWLDAHPTNKNVAATPVSGS